MAHFTLCGVIFLPDSPGFLLPGQWKSGKKISIPD
jgi:hypothetical protein